ncbi:MAG: acyltransferase [Bifidobacteriaceae bacterium]|jgi:hypothetical protein|nr:acyltransferase [Bifidobacteriaceae bacterium]
MTTSAMTLSLPAHVPVPAGQRPAGPAAPVRRDGLLDALRGLSLIAVVLGHWLVTGLTVTGGAGAPGGLAAVSPLAAMPWLAPLTWAVAVLAVFFAVGGRTSAESWGRAAARGETAPAWLARRLRRLAGPLAGAAGAAAVLAGAALAAGIPVATLATVGAICAQPLWFLGVYAVLTALTPLAVRLDRRAGLAAPAAMAGAVAAIDAWTRGALPWAAPSGVGWLALLPGWAFAFQLGARWARGPVGRRAAKATFLGGVGGVIVLMGFCGYSVSMVGGPGLGRSNTHPPSLALLALEAAVVGSIWAWEPALRRAAARPRVRSLSGLAGTAPITILALHQAVALAPALLAGLVWPAAGVPGLTAAPDGLGWVAARLIWLGLFAGLLAAAVRGLRRLEGTRFAWAAG